MHLRSTLKATMTQQEDYALVHWPIEDSVSVVALSKFAQPPIVGKESRIRVGRQFFDGKTIGIGMLMLNNEYLFNRFYHGVHILNMRLKLQGHVKRWKGKKKNI